MREILFRGKRVDNGEWVEGFLVRKTDPLLRLTYSFILKQGFDNSCIDGRQTLLKSEMTWFKVDPETVGQYTGLRDCTQTKEHPNGKRIFEGDIIRKTNEGRHPQIFIANIRTNFRVNEEVYYSPYDHITESCEYEIIGNIHDNPELLEVANTER